MCSTGSGRTVLAASVHSVAMHRELAAAAGDDLAGDGQVVADVDDVLELGQPLLADRVERQHRLQLGAVALAEADEAELAGVAQVDDAAGDRDGLAGLHVRTERLGVVRADDLLERVGARDGDRVRVLAALDELLTLLPPHPHLLGQVVGVVAVVAHEEQA